MRQNEFIQHVNRLTKRERYYVKKYALHPDQIPLPMRLFLQIFYPEAYQALQAISTTIAFAHLALRLIREIEKRSK